MSPSRGGGEGLICRLKAEVSYYVVDTRVTGEVEAVRADGMWVCVSHPRPVPATAGVVSTYGGGR